MNRRKFMKKGLQSTVAVGAGVTGGNILASCSNTKSLEKNITAAIPMPIQVVIDDVGWWSGKDGSEYQEPYRTGINRNHVPADYQAIVDLGMTLGIQPQAAMVLGEWDKRNILRKVPHSTWMGESWDNGKWVGPWLEESADIINNNKDNFEITLHGLGHEWWTDGKFTRAEWADNEGVMRPREDVERHLDAFAEIMRQNNLGELPKSFVPTAFRHGFGVTEGSEVSIAELLGNRGFSYINTPFEIMLNKESVQHGVFGVDSGIMTVDRGVDIFDWNIISTNPVGTINGSTCGMHWPNLLHEDPERNSEIVEGWVKLLAPYKDNQETMLAKNSLFFQKQLAHHICTQLEIKGRTIHLGFSETNKPGTQVEDDGLTVKVSSNEELNFFSDNINLVSVFSKKINNSILYSLNLKRTEDKSVLISF